MRAARILAVVATLFLFLAQVAHAEQKAPGRQTYFSFMLGAYMPESEDLDGGVALLLTEGFMINPYVGVQADIGGFSTTTYQDVTATIESITISLKLAIPLAFVEPYVLGGAGANYKGFSGFPLLAACGVNFNFEKLQLGVEARKIWLQDDNTDFGGLMIMTKFGIRY